MKKSLNRLVWLMFFLKIANNLEFTQIIAIIEHFRVLNLHSLNNNHNIFTFLSPLKKISFTCLAKTFIGRIFINSSSTYLSLSSSTIGTFKSHTSKPPG
ncbi:unnamed protein product [Meloidogyne enterolobii]|uniref:Uncharacterized protein n=1 Tax=Meloidogyne enterolobii TaxID=390850 RepID=A0ACB1ASM2_MELEN